MARKPAYKELTNTRILKEYASWIYCNECGCTVAYLCYVTYDLFDFEYTCNCGNHGKISIGFECREPEQSGLSLIKVSNRLCCPKDNSPLFTVVEKNIKDFNFGVACGKCNTVYKSGI